ncbi:glycosyltransferase family 39 protein [Candidatus Roizmanbacteria bacterium]|nr:glycosyltransferase family 39 protein [Candidatus Roizmanbacteria bacterium]
MNLIQNIIDNFNLLKADFISVFINFYGIINFLGSLIIASIIFAVYYFLGKKIRQKLFKENTKYLFFVNTALGFIAVSTGIALLGFFSLLKPQIISAYLLFVVILTFYSVNLKFNITRQINYFKNIDFSKNLLTLGVFLFVFIAFLRLINPEITEDAYHTDLPTYYLATGTSMHATKEDLRVIPYPQLPEMTYLIPIFLGDKETTRFIHFGFYLLIIFLLCEVAKKKESSFAKFAPILFATAPLTIRYSPSQYTDFFMIFCFLLSVLLITKNAGKKQLILSGIIFGAAISTKVWILVYLPTILIYIFILNEKFNKKKILKNILFFTASSLSIAGLWYIRSFIITGDPLYPIFSKLGINFSSKLVLANHFKFNWGMFSYQNMAVLSPLFFLGIIFCLFSWKNIFAKIKKFPFSIFILILFLEQLIIEASFGRYLFAWFTITTIIISAGIVVVWQKYKIAKYIFITSFFVIFIYYFINTLLVLPYGLGWADKNAYLTRTLGRDNASYYDFNHSFDKWITKGDLVATYKIYGYYYANFSYIDTNYIVNNKNKSFDLLKKRKVAKLLIKGGDIEWFCKTLSLTSCDKSKVKLLATYPDSTRKYNLYEIFKY